MYSELLEEEQLLSREMTSARSDSVTLKQQLEEVEAELEHNHTDHPKFNALRDIRDGLIRLGDMQASELFWGENYNQQQADEALARIQNMVADHEQYLEGIEEKRDALKKKFQHVQLRIHALNEEIIDLQQKALEMENEFVVEREAPEQTEYRPLEMPWSGNKEDEKRFRRTVGAFMLLCLIMAVVIPNWEIPAPPENEAVEIPKRLAELIVKKKKPKPKPKVEQKKKEEKKEKPKEKRPRKDTPKPTTEAQKKARAKAVQSGVLAFSDSFSSLMDTPADAKLGSRAKLSNNASQASTVQRSIVTAKAGTSSGGINVSGISRGVRGTKSIGGVSFSRVESSIGDISEQDQKLTAGAAPSRTDEEIQIVFDRYKSALYRIYNRELRKNPTLQGKMVLKLTIEPDGSVSKCSVSSSELKAPKLEAKIVARVKQFNFGAKKGVKAVTILYPIEFLPAT